MPGFRKRGIKRGYNSQGNVTQYTPGGGASFSTSESPFTKHAGDRRSMEKAFLFYCSTSSSSLGNKSLRPQERVLKDDERGFVVDSQLRKGLAVPVLDDAESADLHHLHLDQEGAVSSWSGLLVGLLEKEK